MRVAIWRRRMCVVILGCSACMPVLAIETYQEYRKLIESAQNLTALKDDLFGEAVSLYTGKTEFGVTDIDLSGNSDLPVQLRRRFSAELDHVHSSRSTQTRTSTSRMCLPTPYILLVGADTGSRFIEGSRSDKAGVRAEVERKLFLPFPLDSTA